MQNNLKIAAVSTRKPARKVINGRVIFRGPSLIDGSPIVVIAITRSSNRKTGNMVQTYILRSDMAPIPALMSGQDVAICGTCKHRPALGGACYVNVGQGVTSVFKAWTRGNYPLATMAELAELGKGRMVRLGTYGDPMAAPVDIWQALVSQAAGRTGYSHQWMDGDYTDAQRYGIMSLCMASADTETEADIAHSIGFRTFRVRRPDDALMAREFVCPASEEGGKRKLCDTCGACNGNQKATGANPVIIAHGSKASRFINIAAI